jgi:hypothetical protein
LRRGASRIFHINQTILVIIFIVLTLSCAISFIVILWAAAAWVKHIDRAVLVVIDSIFALL